MTCTNKACSIFVICQKKDKPCKSKISCKVLQNGYRAMAWQEQQVRTASIDFNGDFG